ncbi:MAG: protein kinase [Bacteroidales bacterium]|nr:protein kinase [Bacteroidales bacterium]
MQKRIIGKKYSFTFDFEIPETDENSPADLGLVFHGKCEQTGTPVMVRYIQNQKLILSPQHLDVVHTIFEGLNLIHSGIAQTYDCICDETGLFFVREYLVGMTLQQIAFTGDYPHLRNQKFLLLVAEKTCEILSALHKNKVIHRRIQPSNIFLVANELGQIDTVNPTVKLINLEYAQINGQNMLNFGTIPYTLYYSAPELVLQCGVLVNDSCDLYSLGISLYEAFAREHAFICENDDKNLLLNMQLSYPLKRHHRIPKQIFPLIQKATAKHIFTSPPMRYKPEARTKFFFNAQQQRFKTADEMKEELHKLISTLPDTDGNWITRKLKKLGVRK